MDSRYELPRPEPTKRLIDAAKAGNEDAWSQIDSRYRGALVIMMRGRIPSGARARFDTEDLIQSTFLSAYRDIDGYQDRGEGSFRRWLVRILENHIRTRIRSQRAAKRDLQRDRRLSDYNSAIRDSAKVSSPDDIVQQAERSALLVQALADLPEPDRQLVSWHVLDGRPMNDVAGRLGLSESAARRRLVKIIGALVQKLPTES